MLVTGGSGFIGGNFVQYMVKKYPEYDIYNLDVLTYAGELTKHRNIQSMMNYFFVKAVITDRKTIFSLFTKEKFDYIVHFAAENHVDRSITDPEVFVRTNILGQVLLDAAKHIGVEKSLHVSTDEVYGELDFDPAIFFTEETPLPYRASKASSDLLVRAYHETFHLPINITRCSNNYGPFHFPEKIIPLTILRVLNNEKIPVYGDGKNVRDWLHVYDHCSALALVLHKGVNGEIYNVGGNNEKANLEVVKTILHALGKSEELITFVPDRLGHDKRYAICPKKLMKLGWAPHYSFEKGISMTVDWFILNKWWWKQVMNEEYLNYIEQHYTKNDGE
ncbi:dTDP-glucose 4,6-dehydratase [Peribacillus sp. NPDC056705]|uniref:dTDP-glucose 4,6-dehydratase n=1 Tax=Peribacillus sp. NPDC056705 TaxID=3345918 RepID=UPI003749A10C